jgi:hypothetical protein
MSIQSTHPDYDNKVQDWETIRDVYKGERHIKSKGLKYLPSTKGMQLDGMGVGQLGLESYNAYKMRAVFPEYTKQAIDNFIGMLWRKPPVIKLPSTMESMRDNATLTGESLVSLLRRINHEQLMTGRCGIMLDLPESNELNAMPYIAFYAAEAIRNWDDNHTAEGRSELNLVVLDESSLKRTDSFTWSTYEKYRLLLLGELDKNETVGTAVYNEGVFTQDSGLNYTPTNMITPMFRGKTLTEVPFVFINTKDLQCEPDDTPLLHLANQCLTIYRGEADYRQSLFMQGQDTLVVIGGVRKKEDEQIRTGTGAMLHVEQGGDAKYIGVDGRGLPEQRYALVNDRLRAEITAGQLTNTSDKVESGIAMQTRLGAQTSTLAQIAITAAKGLERILRICAEWIGANPEEVEVQPNLEFATNELDGQTLLMYMQAKQLGAPISNESLHKLMVSKGMTVMPFQEELKLAEQELKEAQEKGVAQEADKGYNKNSSQDPANGGKGTNNFNKE